MQVRTPDVSCILQNSSPKNPHHIIYMKSLWMEAESVTIMIVWPIAAVVPCLQWIRNAVTVTAPKFQLGHSPGGPTWRGSSCSSTGSPEATQNSAQ